jgi:argininosuccinate lyase
MTLWHGRFAKSPAKSVREISESISYDKELYEEDINGSKAHVAMLAEQKIIPLSSAKKISSALDQIKKEIENQTFPFSEELEDIHMNIEKALIDRLGGDGAKVHTARSRNDQVNLDTRLYMRKKIRAISENIRELQRSLISKASEYKDVIMPGFTHLQHAQPILFAHHLLAYCEMFERDIDRLEDCLRRVNVMPLGSAALAGTTLPINRKSTAEKLAFPKISENSLDAVADRDFICEFLSALAIFAMHISRLSEDIILWVSQEFSYVSLGDEFCTGSSLMPQKKNPDVAELCRGKTGRLYGNLIHLLTICKGLPLSYNRDLQEDKEPLFDSVKTVEKILAVYPQMIASITCNKRRMLEAASDPGLMATDIAEYLVMKGIPFRNAHKMVGELVKHAEKNATTIDKLALPEIKKIIPAADKDIFNLFSPSASVSKRNLQGGTAPEQISSRLKFWSKKLK